MKQNDSKISKGNTDIMVCVTGQKTCERLIRHGAARAERVEDSVLHVIHCVRTGQNFMNTPYEADAIEYLFTAAQLSGAELTMLRADNVDDALVSYAVKNGVDIIIMGATPGTVTEESIAERLSRRLPGVEFDII